MDLRLHACALPDDGAHGLERIRDAVILADLRKRVSELITATGTSPDVIPDKQRYLVGLAGTVNSSHPRVRVVARSGLRSFFGCFFYSRCPPVYFRSFYFVA